MKKKVPITCKPLAMPHLFVTEIRLPSFHLEKDSHSKANKPIKKFEEYISSMAANYVLTGSSIFSNCLVETLIQPAKKEALLNFDYNKNNKQAWYAMEWLVSSIGMAYSIVKTDDSLPTKKTKSIERWLVAVAKNLIKYPGGPNSCCNNHANWRGLAAISVSIVSSDENLFKFGVEKYKNAIDSINKDGSFPLEMKRNSKAVNYQNFAILPLVHIAEFAERQGIDLYSYKSKKGDLHKAIEFLFKALNSLSVDKKYSLEKQELSFIQKKWALNWLEPYFSRFQHQETGRFLESKRPIHHRYAGGPSTIFFFTLSCQKGSKVQKLSNF